MKVISNIVLSHVVSLIALTSFNVYVFLKGKTTALLKSFHLLSLGPLFWLGGKLVKIVAPNLALRWSGILAQYFGIALIGPSFLLFCLTFFLQRWPRRGLTAAIFIPSFLVYLLIASNPLHRQFYTVFTLYRDAFGTVFYLNSGLIYVYLAIGAILLSLRLFRQKRKYRSQIFLFIIAALIPLVTSRYYPRIGDLYSGMRFDITPVSFNLSFLCFGIAAFRYDFLDLPRIAYGQVLELLNDGVIVSDEEGTRLYANAAARGISPPPENGLAAGRYRVHGSCFAYRRSVLSPPGQGRRLSMIVIRDSTQKDLRRQKLRESTARLRKLSDAIQRKIEEERAFLIMRERNRTAQELHDVLGHSLTLIIAQLEGLRFIRERVSRDATLEHIRAMAREGSVAIDRGFSNFKGASSSAASSLSSRLRELSDRGRDAGLSIELVVSHSEPVVPLETTEAVYAVCRECITNALQHGRAERIVIVIDFSQDISVRVLDNGSGCGKIIEGTGLSGMRTRITALGGRIEFDSSPGEGFSVSMFLPLSPAS
jgi:signal transduction histidine kinase